MKFLLTYRYSGVDGLMNCLCQSLWWHKHKETGKNCAVLSAFSFSSTHSIAIAQRIERLFSDITRGFYYKGVLRKLRYIVEVQQSYFIVSTDLENFSFERAEGFSGLCDILSRPQNAFVPIVADRHALSESVLPKVLSNNKIGKIQLFYKKNKNNKVEIYVLDDHGSLFYQALPFHDDQALMSQFSLFFDSILSRCGHLQEQDVATNFNDSVEYICLSRKVSGSIQFERINIDIKRVTNQYFHVQVIGNVVNQKTVFTIYCNDHEFSSYEHGSSLFKQVAQYVLNQRKSGVKYPIYITDLDLAPGLLDDRPSNSVQIIEFLNYKKRIEQKLNSELARL